MVSGGAHKPIPDVAIINSWHEGARRHIQTGPVSTLAEVGRQSQVSASNHDFRRTEQMRLGDRLNTASSANIRGRLIAASLHPRGAGG